MAKLTTSQIAAQIGVSERTIQRWIAEGRLPAQPIARRQYLVAESDIEALRPSQVDEVISHTEERIQALEDRINALERRVSELETQLERKTPAPSQPKMLRPAPAEYSITPGEGLPEGVVAMMDFAKLHTKPDAQPPETTIRRAHSTGQLPVVTGKWRIDGRTVQQVLDAAGQAAFCRIFAGSAWFQPCTVESCPCHKGGSDEPGISPM